MDRAQAAKKHLILVLSGSCSQQTQKDHNCASIPLKRKAYFGRTSRMCPPAGFYHAVGHTPVVRQIEGCPQMQAVAPPHARELSI